MFNNFYKKYNILKRNNLFNQTAKNLFPKISSGRDNQILIKFDFKHLLTMNAKIENLFNYENNTKSKFSSYSIFQNSKKNYFKKSSLLYRTRNNNFYEVLGVERESTNDQIKKAYLKLAKQYHPDVNKDPGADDRFKNITLAYEALSNQRNRDLYDAYMDSDPYDNNYEAHFYKDEEDFSRQENSKAKNDKKSGGFYRNSHDSNFWRGERDDFEEKFYKDYENIFSGGFKESKPQKGDDILVLIK